MNSLINGKQVQGFGFGAIVLLLGACEKAEIPSIGGGSSRSGAEVTNSLITEEQKSPEATALEQKLLGSWRKGCEPTFDKNGRADLRASIYDFSSNGTVEIRYFTFAKEKDCKRSKTLSEIYDRLGAGGVTEVGRGTYSVANQVRSQAVFPSFLGYEVYEVSLKTNWAKLNITVAGAINNTFEFEFASLSSESDPLADDGRLIVISKGDHEIKNEVIVAEDDNVLTKIK